MSTISYESISTSDWASVSTKTITPPSGITDNDGLVAVLTIEDGVTVSSAPTGWSLGISDGTAGQPETYVYWKVASSESGSYSWTLSGTGKCAGAILRFSGTHTTDFFDQSAKNVQTNNNTPTFTNTITPSQANSFLVFFIGAVNASDSTVSTYAIANDNPSWTEVFNSTLDGSFNMVMGVAYASRPETSATGNSSAVVGGDAGSDSTGFMFNLAPEPNATVTPSVINLTSSVIDPLSVSAGSIATPSVIDITASIQAPTITTADPKWVNEDKSDTSPTIVNQNKT